MKRNEYQLYLIDHHPEMTSELYDIIVDLDYAFWAMEAGVDRSSWTVGKLVQFEFPHDIITFVKEHCV